MAFFDKINEFTRNVGEMASEALENSRKGSRISEENKKIKELKVQIGDFYLEKCKAGEALDETVMALCAEIQSSEEVISTLQAELEAVQKAQEAADAQAGAENCCPSCGAQIQYGVKFCSECGHKFEKAAKKHCTSCGAGIKDGAAFCAECGARQ